ncbi:hypothetical protein K1W54_22235 [Micromonospora sp. CPCC 205371]|nr:hypothetical protein [Micromonospora sp. CPCC 205371]
MSIGAVLFSVSPASADHDFTCYTDPPVDSRSYCLTAGILKSAATGKYVEVMTDGTLAANATHHGWHQHIEFVRLPDWDEWGEDEWWGLSFSQPGRLASASASGGVLRADSTFIGWYQAFEIHYLDTDSGGAYYSVKHLGSGKWLTAYPDGRLRADSTHVGWNQAFRWE